MTRPARKRIGPEIVGTLLMLSLLFSARASLADHYHVPTGSMQPTVEPGDRVLVNKAAYGVRVPGTDLRLARFGGPAAGDVVVLESPEDGITLLKRVVAVPGQTVEVERGHLTVDGRRVLVRAGTGGLVEEGPGEPHRVSMASGGGPDYGPRTLPADRYLVVGDNRGNSRDGRMFGLVDRDAMRGQVLGVYWRGGFRWDSM